MFLCSHAENNVHVHTYSKEVAVYSRTVQICAAMLKRFVHAGNITKGKEKELVEQPYSLDRTGLLDSKFNHWGIWTFVYSGDPSAGVQ